MSMITDTIMEQMSMAGKPRVSTMTENIQTGQEQQSNQPMNIGNIALLIWLMTQGMGKGKTSTALGETPLPPPLGVSQPTGMPGITPSPQSPIGAGLGGAGMGAQSNPMDFMKMILKLVGGGGGLGGIG